MTLAGQPDDCKCNLWSAAAAAAAAAIICPDDLGFVFLSFPRSAMSNRSVRAINSPALTQLLFHQTCSGAAGGDGGVPADWLNDNDK